METRKKVQEFLAGYHMDYQSIDLDAVCADFIAEMDNGLAGKASSLAMLPTYITMDRQVAVNEKVIVIDAGGTNLRIATVYFDQDYKPVIENQSFYKMPGTSGPVSREEFYRTIAGYLQPVLDQSNKIGFCFSYPTEIMPNRDGRLIFLSKEVTVPGLAGDMIGENLLKMIREMGCADAKSIVMLNDTVSTLLGGAFACADRSFDSYIGLVLGTGTNTCYVERTAAITKLAGGFAGDSMLINIESGGFGKSPRGVIDEEIDQTTNNPGLYKFEKMISGAYQGKLFQAVLNHALTDGLFSSIVPAAALQGPEISAKDLDEFLFHPYAADKVLLRYLAANGIDVQENDRETLYYLIDALIERTAVLAAANLTAILTKIGAGANPCRPTCITADGSTFYKSKIFRDKLNYYVRTYMNEQKGLFCEFIKAENGNMVGSAAAGLQA